MGLSLQLYVITKTKAHFHTRSGLSSSTISHPPEMYHFSREGDPVESEMV